jgi:hypothetical protein
MSFDAEALRANARRFTRERFLEGMRREVAMLMPGASAAAAPAAVTPDATHAAAEASRRTESAAPAAPSPRLPRVAAR